MKIYLDDYREAPGGWRRCFSATSLMYWIEYMPEQMEDITHVSFDHDLHTEHYGIPQEVWHCDPCPSGLVHPTGYDACVAFINFAKENNLPHVILTCHSANPAGKANIEKLIQDYNNTFNPTA